MISKALTISMKHDMFEKEIKIIKDSPINNWYNKTLLKKMLRKIDTKNAIKDNIEDWKFSFNNSK